MDRDKAAVEVRKLLAESADWLTEPDLRAQQARCLRVEQVARAIYMAVEVVAEATSAVAAAVQTPTALEMMRGREVAGLLFPTHFTRRTSLISLASKAATDW
jgi:hypothetical protein